jgi:hypothetical protein
MVIRGDERNIVKKMNVWLAYFVFTTYLLGLLMEWNSKLLSDLFVWGEETLK